MLKYYIKNDHKIRATEYAYNLVYSKEGYIPFEEKVEEKKTRKKKGEADVKQD